MTLRSYELNKLHQLKQKVRLISADISFLKKCKKNKVFPNFIKINIPIKNKVTEQVTFNAKINWLNLEIKHLYSKRSTLELQAYELHLKITQNLNYFQYLLFEERLVYILDKVEYKYEHKLNRLEKKFYKLNTPSKVNTINHSHIEESTT